MQTGAPSLIEGPYFQDILAQPDALRTTLQGFTDNPDLRSIGAALRANGTKRLVLTGMGASLHALLPLELRLIAAGLSPVRVETGELIHHARALLSPGTVLIAVSQSGRSAEIVRLLDDAPGVTVVGVTNDATSPLATGPKVSVLTAAGREATVSCKTYLATLAALQWLGSVLLGEDPGLVVRSTAQVADAVQTYLKSIHTHVAALQATLQGVRQIYFAGRGHSLAAAATAGLITKEAVHFPSEGMSSAAFRHGPLEMAGPESFLMVFEGPENTAALNRGLVDDVLRVGGRAALCGPSGVGPFHLDAMDPLVMPLLEIVPAQLVTLALAVLAGREAGRFTHATKITATE
jgi:glutamine---fructose-6-phosphate transaminase (isomerizing)